jgi:hypothetical protein
VPSNARLPCGFGDVEFLRRRNAVQVGTKVGVGTLKSNDNRTIVLPKFVIDALTEAAKGKGRDDLLCRQHQAAT